MYQPSYDSHTILGVTLSWIFLGISNLLQSGMETSFEAVLRVLVLITTFLLTLDTFLGSPVKKKLTSIVNKRKKHGK